MKDIKIFLFWFGDVVPDYVYWNVENIKKVNDDCDVEFIRYTNNQIKNYKDQNDQILSYSIPEYIKRNNTHEINMTILGNIYKYSYLYQNKNNQIIVNLDVDCFPVSKISNFVSRIEMINNCSNTKNKSYSLGYYHSADDSWFTCIYNNVQQSTNLKYNRVKMILKTSSLLEDYILYRNFYINDCIEQRKLLDNRFDLFRKCKLDLMDSCINTSFCPIEHYQTRSRNRKEFKSNLIVSCH